MNSSKRSSFSSKSSKFNGKLKEILSSRQKVEPKVADIKDFSNVPIIKQIDNARLLPKYTAILAKNREEAVTMNDLDQLQQDLEKLLCTNAIRTRFFLGEYTQNGSDSIGMDDMDQLQQDLEKLISPNAKKARMSLGDYTPTDQSGIHHDKKAHDKTSLKRKRPDEKLKYKDVKNGLRIVKKDSLRFYNETMYQEIPKIALPRNDDSDKFWTSIEPYCAPVSKDDVACLDTLIQEFSKEIDTRIPEIGDHYATAWSEELINDEQTLGKSPTKKPANADFKKNGLHAIVESFGNPFTQRLLSTLVDERSIKTPKTILRNAENCVKINKNRVHISSSDLSKLKHSTGQRLGSCLDKRLLKELVDQGILTQDDISKNLPEDEILTEIKKCQQELMTVNKYNLEELNKLKSAVMNDIHCNQLKDDLDKIDQEVLDLYKNIMATRKKALQAKGKDYEKVFSESIITEFEQKTNALLRQQHVLNREINSMTDKSMLY